MRAFHFFLFFKFVQAVLEIFEFKCSKKEGNFRQVLERTYISGVASKIFDGLFFNFLGKNIHNFVKNDPKFKNERCKIL